METKNIKMNEPSAFVLITPESKVIKLAWKFTTHYNDLDDGGVACYIPSFDIYFSASDKEGAQKKSRSILRCFFNHFLGHEDKRGLGKLAIQLHKLGFKALNDTMTIKRFLDNDAVKAKFSSVSNIIPPTFSKERQMVQEEELAVNI